MSVTSVDKQIAVVVDKINTGQDKNNIPHVNRNGKCIACMSRETTNDNKMFNISDFRLESSNCECKYCLHEKCYEGFKERINRRCPACNEMIDLQNYTIIRKSNIIIPKLKSKNVKVKHTDKYCYITIDLDPETLKQQMKIHVHNHKEMTNVHHMTQPQINNSVICCLLVIFILLCIIIF